MLKNVLGAMMFIIIGFYILWIIFVSPILSSNTDCFAHESRVAEDDYRDAKSIADSSLRKEYVCKASEESYVRLKSCIVNSEAKNTIGRFIVDSIPFGKYQPKTYLESAASEHNKICVDNPVQ